MACEAVDSTGSQIAFISLPLCSTVEAADALVMEWNQVGSRPMSFGTIRSDRKISAVLYVQFLVLIF